VGGSKDSPESKGLKPGKGGSLFRPRLGKRRGKGLEKVLLVARGGDLSKNNLADDNPYGQRSPREKTKVTSRLGVAKGGAGSTPLKGKEFLFTFFCGRRLRRKGSFFVG